MNEPWISPGILGGIFGVLGDLVALGCVLFVFDIIAYLFEQPGRVWLTSVIAGLDCAASFAICYWIVLKRARYAELRKLMAEDLTFGCNKDDQQKQEESTEPSVQLPVAKAQEVPKSVLLKEVFPKLDHLLSKSKEFKKNLKRATPKNFTEFNARGKALEDEVQSYCRRIAKEFPGAVIFITFQGQEWAYDVDFQMIKNSLEEPVPAELEGYFRYASLRKMFRLRKIPSKQLQQMQPTRR